MRSLLLGKPILIIHGIRLPSERLWLECGCATLRTSTSEIGVMPDKTIDREFVGVRLERSAVSARSTFHISDAEDQDPSLVGEMLFMEEQVWHSAGAQDTDGRRTFSAGKAFRRTRFVRPCPIHFVIADGIVRWKATRPLTAPLVLWEELCLRMMR